MITVTERVDRTPASLPKELPPLRAIAHLTQNYLFWSEGHVLYATDTSLHVMTKLWRQNHIGQYEGPAGEICALHNLIGLYTAASSTIASRLLPDTDPCSESFAGVVSLMKTHQLRAKMGMLYAAGVDRESILMCSMHATHDLAAALLRWEKNKAIPFHSILV